MTYQALARKWRPTLFSQITGQNHIIYNLINSLKLKRIHHAYLFSGPRGVGKTTIARLLAKSLNCQTGITDNPCRQCYNCLQIEQGFFTDLIEIDAASRTKVEDIRDLLDKIQYSPISGRFIIYLIDEVHMLSRYSFNTLLKTLEEPPKHVKFFLATTDPQKLPITIRSRCLHFYLKLLTFNEIYKKLIHVIKLESINIELTALKILIRFSKGSMRDVLNLVDQAINTANNKKITVHDVTEMLSIIDEENIIKIIQDLITGNIYKIMEKIELLASQGIDWELFIEENLRIIHKIAINQIIPENSNNNINLNTKNENIDTQDLYSHFLYRLSKKIPPTILQIYYQIFLTGLKELSLTYNHRMVVEMIFLRAIALHPVDLSSYSSEEYSQKTQKTQNNKNPFIQSINNKVNKDILISKEDITQNKLINKYPTLKNNNIQKHIINNQDYLKINNNNTTPNIFTKSNVYLNKKKIYKKNNYQNNLQKLTYFSEKKNNNSTNFLFKQDVFLKKIQIFLKKKIKS